MGWSDHATLNISPVDQTKKDDTTFEGEAVRLANELRSAPGQTIIGPAGERQDIPAKQGFDIETADFNTMVNYLADTRIKKAESSRAFIHRVLAWRFPTEYAQKRDSIDNRYKLEYEMIQSNSKKDIEDLGMVGFQNNVRLDGSLTKNYVRTEKQRNGNIRSVKK